MRVLSLEDSHADHRERVHQGGLGGIPVGHGQVANPAARRQRAIGSTPVTRRTEPRGASSPMNP
jgi:hypothetical protein